MTAKVPTHSQAIKICPRCPMCGRRRQAGKYDYYCGSCGYPDKIVTADKLQDLININIQEAGDEK